MKYLLVIPSIDIKDGKTVRVVQGIPELDCLEYGSDPIEMARIWRAENAKIIHIVDFDAAVEHSHKNLPIIEEICNSVIIPVEFAGGVRNYEDAKILIEAGILRLVITTMAIENRSDFIKVFEKFGPARIVTALDILDGQITIRGRKTNTGIFYRDFARDMADIGIERFIVTDVRKNGVMGGPNLELAEEISELTGGKITLSGGIRNKDELLDVQNMMQFGIDSVIVGRALYENRFPCQKLWRVAESGIFK
jgi:phosphoribosylformimino-5-aminoimidazole carboxamide ribotide isomerase